MPAPSKPPLIGLNTDDYQDKGTISGLREGYWRAVVKAGGVPIVIPHLESREALESALAPLDGFVLIGGDDIRAERYGEKTLPVATLMEESREKTDFELIQLLLEMRKPTLAICLGFQELNVAHGGTLCQDLPTEKPDSPIRHHAKDGVASLHSVAITDGSRLSDALGMSGQLEVNSTHHQAVKQLGKGLRAVAEAPDGVIEGIEVVDQPFFIGVQWHPEKIADRPIQMRLFETLVQESSRML